VHSISSAGKAIQHRRLGRAAQYNKIVAEEKDEEEDQPELPRRRVRDAGLP
jgi:hypothetical protein